MAAVAPAPLTYTPDSGAPDISAAPASADEMIAAIEAVRPRLQANALAEEKVGRLSDDTIRVLDDIGVFRVGVPEAYGGPACSTDEQRRIYAAIGKIAGSTGWVSWVTTAHNRWVAMFSREAQDDVFASDWVGPLISGVVSPNGGPGRARRVEGGYMISGRWPFCSGCRNSAWSILGSVIETSDGEWDTVLPLVRTSELNIIDDWAVSGMKATGSNTVELREELFVPDYRAMAMKDLRDGRWASPPPPGAIYRTNFLDHTSLLSGSTPLGMAQGALEYYRERLDRRGITGTDYTVQGDAAVTHFQLADATARITAAERLLAQDCHELDRRAMAGVASDNLFQAKIKFDVALSVRDCCEAVEMLHRGSGASTIHEANPMQRYARDIRVATVHAHFNYETCAENYGRALAGKPLFGARPALAGNRPG